jgi:hypothetical protein
MLIYYALYSEHLRRWDAYRVLLGKPEEKNPLGRSRYRWDDDPKMGLREIELGRMDWIDPAQDRDKWRALVNTAMNLRVPYNCGRIFRGWATWKLLTAPWT